MLNNRLFYKYRVTFSVALFLGLAVLVHGAKPSLLYNSNGSFRSFGVGYKDKTVIPGWLLFMVLAVFSYMFLCTRAN